MTYEEFEVEYGIYRNLMAKYSPEQAGTSAYVVATRRFYGAMLTTLSEEYPDFADLAYCSYKSR